MSFTDEEFDRLEKEIATLFLPPPARREPGTADKRRVDSILSRLREGSDAEGERSDGGDEPQIEAE